MNENPEGTPNPLNPGASSVNPEVLTPAIDPTAMSGTGMPVPVVEPAQPVIPTEVAVQPEFGPAAVASNGNTTPSETFATTEAVTTSGMDTAATNDISNNAQPEMAQAEVMQAEMIQTEVPQTGTPQTETTTISEASVATAPTAGVVANEAVAATETMPAGAAVEQLLNTPEMMAASVTATTQPTTTEPTASANTKTAEKPKKRSRMGLVITLVLFFVVLIGAAVAAILFFDPFGFRTDDRVPTAISKLFSEGTPKNVAINGSISMSTGDENAALTSLNITYTSELNTESADNTTNATITAFLADETEFSFNVDEIHTQNGDLYLKLSGLAESFGEYKANETTNCEGDASGETNCATSDNGSVSLLEELGMLEVIDDQWIMIPGNQFSVLTDFVPVDKKTQCLVDAAGRLSQYGSDFGKAYQNNAFVSYSTDKLTIAKRKDPLYRLTLDENKFAGFINGMTNSGFMNELNACMGADATSGEVAASELTDIIKAVPTMYVEINDDYQFTRVYLRTLSEDGTTEAIVDMALSYPETIKIELPDSYIEYTQILTTIFPELTNDGDAAVEDDTVVEEGEVIYE